MLHRAGWMKLKRSSAVVMKVVDIEKSKYVLEASEYLNRYFSNYTVYDNFILDLLPNVVNAIEAGIDIDIIFQTVLSSLEKSEDAQLNLLQYLLISEYEKKVHYMEMGPYSKRIGLIGDLLKDDYLMSEGNHKASTVLSEIRGVALKEKETSSFENSSMMDRLDCMIQVSFDLDKFNIRGVQILDAMDYTKGSAQLLYEIIRNGQPDEISALIEYINSKAALRIKNGESLEENIACLNGLNSFDSEYIGKYNLVMTKENVDSYLRDANPLSFDFSKIDICGFTNKKAALDAASARGFRVIKDTNPTFEDGKLSSIIMYNDKTGAIIDAPGVSNDNFCYAGCELYFVAKGDLKHSFDENVSFNRIPETDLIKCQSNYTDGLFSYYDKCVDKLIPINNFVFPIPSYVRADNAYFINSETHPFINDVLIKGNRNLSSRVYAINGTINLLLLKYDNEIQNSGVSLYEPLKDKEICSDDAFIKELISKAGLYVSEIEKGLNILNIAFCYLQVPETEQIRIVEAVENELENDFDRYSKSPFAKNITIKDVHESFRRYKSIKNDDVAMNKLFDALNLQEVKTIPVDLPWEIKERKDFSKDDIERVVE